MTIEWNEFNLNNCRLITSAFIKMEVGAFQEQHSKKLIACFLFINKHYASAILRMIHIEYQFASEVNTTLAALLIFHFLCKQN